MYDNTINYGKLTIFHNLIFFFFSFIKYFLGGWIRGLAFNKTGDRLCWVAHDSSITVADVSKGSVVVNKLKTNELPFISCFWVTDRAIVAAVSNHNLYLNVFV